MRIFNQRARPDFKCRFPQRIAGTPKTKGLGGFLRRISVRVLWEEEVNQLKRLALL